MPAPPAPAFRPAAPTGAAGLWPWVLLMLVAGFVSIAASQLALGLALLTLLWGWWRQGARPPRTGLEGTAAALALWALAMVPLSTDVARSALYYRRFYLFTALWVCAAVAVSERRRGQMLACFLGGALVTCLHDETLQLVHHGSLFRDRMDVSFNAMTSGALLMMAALVAAGFALAPGVGRRLRALCAAALVPLGLGLAMTMTRSAELGLLAGGAAMLAAARRRLFAVFAGGLAVVVLVGLLLGPSRLPPLLYQRLTPANLLGGENTVLRLEMWRGGLAMVRANPWTGVGDRDLAAISPQYYVSESGRYWGHLHSNPLHMAAIWGLPGFAFASAFLLAGLWCLWRRWRAVRAAGAPLAAGWALGALGVWFGFNVAGLSEWYFGDAEPTLLYLAVLGIALGGSAGPDGKWNDA
jgi:O-antigen ligase